MKAIILQSNFSRALNQISRIVGSRATLPVLGNILISVEKGKINFSATDLEVGISTQVIGKIEEEGSITVPARLMADFVQNNKDESINISIDGNAVKFKSERYEATIQGISAEEFPTVPEPPKETVAKISRTKLIDALKKTIIAGATDETRPVLAGIYMYFNQSDLILASTDSYRLAEKKITLDASVSELKIIVPLRTMAETLRIISAEDSIDEVVVSAKESQVSFHVGNTYIVSRLIEGSFPNYAQIIPASFKTTAEMKLADLLGAVKMSSLFARDSANNNIRIKIDKEKVFVSSVASESGSASSEVESKVSGDPVEIAFNARYVLDILNVIGDDKIIIALNDSGHAGAIKSVADQNFVYIIMPLRLE